MDGRIAGGRDDKNRNVTKSSKFEEVMESYDYHTLKGLDT